MRINRMVIESGVDVLISLWFGRKDLGFDYILVGMVVRWGVVIGFFFLFFLNVNFYGRV